MSQHDYDLANAAGAAFRSDLNNALAAIVSQNSGATEPATTFAYQLWADTTSGWVKQRNSANSGWIKRFPIGTDARVDVASAATLDLDASAASSSYLRITGTTTITAVTLTDGQQRLALAGGAFVLTHGASLVLPGAANYTTTAGDLILFIGEASSVVRVMVWRSSGTPITADEAMAQRQAQTGTAYTTGGTSTAYTLTPSPALTALAENQEFDVEFHAAAGATPTLAISGLTAKSLKYRNSAGTLTAVTSTQIPSGWRSKVTYDGTDYIVREVPPASASGGGLVYLGGATASNSATVDLTSLLTSAYKHFLITIEDLIPQTDATDLYMRTSTDNGSTFDSGVSDYLWIVSIAQTGYTAQFGSNGDSKIDMMGTDNSYYAGNASGEGLHGEIWLSNPLGTAVYKSLSWVLHSPSASSSRAQQHRGTGYRAATADVDAVRFYMSSGNITSGRFKVYGLADS